MPPRQHQRTHAPFDHSSSFYSHGRHARSYFQKLEGVYGRRDAQIVYQSNAFNSDVVTFRAGLRRRDSSSSCSFVLVAFDNAVATGTA